MLLPGSSPLARGLRRRGVGCAIRARIIPARAGFTAAERSPSRMSQDHPRSRGVYPARPLRSLRTGGSSPLARGLQAGACSRRLGPGIIPARAGFTKGRSRCGHATRDHPRSRGVYLRRAMDGMNLEGSSPLARGLLMDGVLTRPVARIIPARAGFTPSMRVTFPSTRDHPRSRGVYSGMSTDEAVSQGSSPLARGLPLPPTRRRRPPRIIPARAGFTLL